MSDEATWLYAVVPRPSPAAPETTGVAGQPVRIIEHAQVSAVVSSIGLERVEQEALRRELADPARLEEFVRSHHRVVTEQFELAPTVPFRLATVCPDDGRVHELLERRYDDLVAALATVARRAEWAVQARPAAAAHAAAPVEDDRPGIAYLQRRRAEVSQQEAAQRTAASCAEQVNEALSRLAVAASRQPPAAGQDGRSVLNAAYLVDDEQHDRFTTAVRAIGEQHRVLRLRVTGPWPAYSFVEIATEHP